MTYRIELSKKVTKQLKALPVAVRSLIQTKLKALGIEPRPPGVVKLKKSESQYRIRVGNYRVIYEIEDEILLILVLKVAHRQDAYKD
jgi:mRNA interferase RelE/StbE